MRVFIAEKPSVGMEIAKALGGNIQRGNGFVLVDGKDAVTWCVGHLISQAKPEAYGEEYAQWSLNSLPIVPEKWQMEPNPKTKDQLKAIKGLLKDATMVVNAGDSAREGQLIVDEVLHYFGYKGPAKRLWLREMNLPAIRKGIAAMRDNREYAQLHDCALARSRADWIMGMNLTRGYTVAWQSKGNEDTLHIGRVQTPALCLIVERDLLIENFKPEDFFTLKGTFRHKNGIFEATWVAPEGAAYLDDAGRVKDKAVLMQIASKLKEGHACVTNYKVEAKKRFAPLPFSLGDLQKAANKALGLSPSDTLKIAQALYEKHKLTTYPRTDYSHLPEDEHGMSSRIIEACKTCLKDQWDFEGQPDFNIKSAAWNNSKIGDHHGIRPTTVKDYDMGQLSKNELIIYKMIVRNFLAQFYPPYLYDSTAIELEAQAEKFKTSGAVERHPGWTVLFKGGKDDDTKDKDAALPQMAEGDPCMIEGCNVEAKKTAPPPRYDGASIIDAMEKAYKFVTDPKVKPLIQETGIGTPATRSAIVDNLIDRSYIDEVKQSGKKVYISTAKGRMLYQAVPPQLRKPDLTAYFEELLKQIEAGKLTMSDFMAHQVKYVTKLVNDIKEGKVAANMPSLRDCAPPERKGAKGKKGPEATQEEPKTCAKCGKPMRLRPGAKGPFYGCTGYPDCKHTEDAGRTGATNNGAKATAPSSGKASQHATRPAPAKPTGQNSAGGAASRDPDF